MAHADTTIKARTIDSSRLKEYKYKKVNILVLPFDGPEGQRRLGEWVPPQKGFHSNEARESVYQKQILKDHYATDITLIARKILVTANVIFWGT
ncbi:hypothetical protein Tco_1197612, partial [Tanacetum coccineum]